MLQDDIESGRLDHGVVSWVCTLPQGGRHLQGRIHDFWGRGILFGMVPAGTDSLYWAAAARTDLAQQLTDVPRRCLRALLAGAADTLTEVIEATPEADLHRYRLYDIEPGLPWLRDRVLLVGDAAHASLPTSGQGAAKALEDWKMPGAWLAQSAPPAAGRNSSPGCRRSSPLALKKRAGSDGPVEPLPPNWPTSTGDPGRPRPHGWRGCSVPQASEFL